MKSKLFYTLFAVLLVSIVFLGCAIQKSSNTPWEQIFDGKTLKGWSIKGGDASYEVVNGTIIGTSTLNTPNTFLCSDKLYSDFILELEYKIDSLLNSGIQIRSNSNETYSEGRVHGYQIEIDPSERAWSAGVYDEARRGWLNPLKDNPEAQKAFKQNDWNHYRIEAIGDTIKTWINGVAASYLIDDMTSEGFIGLQVHGIGNDKTKDGTQVIWRNINLLTENIQKYARKSKLTPIITKTNLVGDKAKD